jgi:thiamine-monophosphate kinase
MPRHDDPFSEHDFLAWLRREMPDDPRIEIGIGDDCALLRRETGAPQLLAIDTVVEGTHAFSGPDLPEILGRKVVLANLSDIAAMGGRPEAALLSLKLGRGAAGMTARRVLRAVVETCRRYGLALCGGDTVAGDGGLVLTLAITGTPIARAVTRSGARAGDVVAVTGSFGGSIRGKHADFTPRLEEAAELVHLGPPSAMADVSDGLLRDLANITIASRCGAVVIAEAVPISPAARAEARRSGRSALDHALYDGEDFELVFTMSEESWKRTVAEWRLETPVTRIGRIEPSGLALEESGRRRAVAPGGYDHGSEGSSQ